MASSDADVSRDTSAMEAAAAKEKADRLLAAKKEEAELAVKTRDIATEIKCAFKDKQLSHLKEMDVKAHERQMDIDEAKGRWGGVKSQFD